MSNKTVKLEKSDSNEMIQLICREDDSLTIEIVRNTKFNNQQHYHGSFFLFRLQENNNPSSKRILHIVR